jgi:predicted lipase
MWNNIKAEVISDLKEMSKQTKISTLDITGISLGGGLTVISYIDIAAAKIFPTVRITTYGAPRVGNK